MKVGILTFHFAHNYGAMLQAHALCTHLCQSGYDAEIIDYRLPKIYRYNHEMFGPLGLYKRYREFNGVAMSLLKTVLKYWIHRHPPKKWFRFEAFLNETLVKTARIADLRLINDMGYDAIVCGSDQIWNPGITGSLVPEYFGAGLEDSIIKVAYAGSNGQSQVDSSLMPLFRRYISSFNAVSVREKGLSDFLNEQGISNVHVPDPIFLLSRSDWHALAVPPPHRDYVLTYSFDESEDFFVTAKKVATHLGKKLVCFKYKWTADVPDDAILVTDGGPKELLGYIEHADFVVSNSFHGTAFSVLLGRPFICVTPRTGRERTDSLLSTLGLSERMSDAGDLIKIVEGKIDAGRVRSLLDAQRQQAHQFLVESLARTRCE